ncbi:MAG: hypothetical protein ACRC6X_07795 [Culicoidibacterales bacterium]
MQLIIHMWTNKYFKYKRSIYTLKETKLKIIEKGQVAWRDKSRKRSYVSSVQISRKEFFNEEALIGKLFEPFKELEKARTEIVNERVKSCSEGYMDVVIDHEYPGEISVIVELPLMEFTRFFFLKLQLYYYSNFEQQQRYTEIVIVTSNLKIATYLEKKVNKALHGDYTYEVRGQRLYAIVGENMLEDALNHLLWELEIKKYIAEIIVINANSFCIEIPRNSKTAIKFTVRRN